MKGETVERRRIVLLGATGYTGQRVLRELLARGEEPTLVGRNHTRMAALANSFEANIPVAQVDITSTADLARLQEPSDVVISTVGPFMQLGLATVTAAVQAGAHYFDSTGEGTFVRHVFELDSVATARGATVVPAFGYDYVPGNLAGALALTSAGDRATRTEIGYFVRYGRPPRSLHPSCGRRRRGPHWPGCPSGSPDRTVSRTATAVRWSSPSPATTPVGHWPRRPLPDLIPMR
ncbi:saccharopine dehydrogenase NADP-binding domain-containing protein [Rhodococcus opacus]|uniref:saccharopine dehydrogenase NADP-binding domain-containing protein n=1 Tax=Rhodococcus opacus TaxID=37919 RepID=UPI001F546643|nr:saccharopine dehydrogenase NADP-binding domain-containing protein [Rhodococcus opacus]